MYQDFNFNNPSQQPSQPTGNGSGQQQFGAQPQQPQQSFAPPAMPGQGFNQPVAGPSPTYPTTNPAPGFTQSGQQSTPQPTAQPFQFGDGSSWGAAGQQPQFPQPPQQQQYQQPQQQWSPASDPNTLAPFQSQQQPSPFAQPLVQPSTAQQWPSQSQLPQPPQQSAVDPRLQQQLVQYGVDPNLPTDQQLAALNQRMQAMYAAYSQAGEQPQQQFAQQQVPQEPAQPQADEFDPDKYFSEAWKQPAWNPQFDQAINSGIVVRDDNGLFRPAPGYEMLAMPLIGPLNEAMQAQTQNVQQLFRDNPYRKFYEVTKEPIRREILREAQEIVRQELAVVRDREVVQEFEKQNAAWLYATDQFGRKVTTPAGEAFLREAESLVQLGMPMQRAIEVAQRMLPPQMQTQFQAPQQQLPGQPMFPPLVQPAGQANVLPPIGQQPMAMQQPYAQPQMGMPQVQQPYQQQLPFMGQPGQYTPNPPMLGAQPFAPAQASAMQQQSFIDSALQRSSYQPYASGAWAATAPQGQASPSTDGLETMFTDAARRMAA